MDDDDSVAVCFHMTFNFIARLILLQEDMSDNGEDVEEDEDEDDIGDDQSFASVDDLEGEWHKIRV
jgi:hypothetical protein